MRSLFKFVATKMSPTLPAAVALSRRFISAPVSEAEVAALQRVPEEQLKTLNPRTSLWIGIDRIGREKLAPFVQTTDGAADYWELYQNAIKAVDKTAVPAGAKEALAGAKDIAAFLTAYAGIIGAARVMKREWHVTKLEDAYMRDRLKIGSPTFNEEQLEEAKVKLAAAEANALKLEGDLTAIGKEYFTTEMFNDFINAMRIVSETNKSAHEVTLQLFDDMSLVGVAFNDATKLLLNNVTFGDGPLEDSALLFSLVEYPERGEVVVAPKQATLEAMAKDAFKVIAERHQTPVDNGGIVQSDVTHPCIQRSPN